VQGKTSVQLENTKRSLGGRIRNLRISKGLTQEDFCKKNMLRTAANLSDIEKGKTLATVDTILRICINSNISADSLLFGSAMGPIKNDSEEFARTRAAVQSTLSEYARILRAEEARLRQELNQAIEKRDSLSLLMQAASAGLFNHEKGDLYSVTRNLSVVKGYIEFLEKDLDDIRSRSKRLEQDKKTLLLTFG